MSESGTQLAVNQRKDMTMKQHFVVCDEIGNTSYSEKNTTPERFNKFETAKKRAEGLAKQSPGIEIYIYEAVAFAKTPVGKTETSRKYPAGHYSHDG